MGLVTSLAPVALMDVGLAAALIGTVSLAKPMPLVGIGNRSQAAVWLTLGVLAIVVAILWPAPDIAVTDPRSALDRATPSYQFHEFHAIAIRARPERIYRAIRDVTADEIILFHTLTWIRRFGRPGQKSVLNAPERQPLLDVATRTTFLALADAPDEIVVGTVVIAPPGWRGRTTQTPDEFAALRHKSGFALGTMNFEINHEGDGAVVTTETRVYATDAASRRRFAVYWRLIYPGSAFIRRMWLRAIKNRAEMS
jgi:hypothetical protein